MHFQRIGKIFLSIQVHRGTRYKKHKETQKAQNENVIWKSVEFSLGVVFYYWVKVW